MLLINKQKPQYNEKSIGENRDPSLIKRWQPWHVEDGTISDGRAD